MVRAWFNEASTIIVYLKSRITLKHFEYVLQVPANSNRHQRML